MSIQFTVAVVAPVLPAISINVNVKLPFPVKVYIFDPQLFVIVIPVLLNPVSVAMTFQLVNVHDHGLYMIFAVGFVVSILYVIFILI